MSQGRLRSNTMRIKDPIQRFWSHVDKSADCWVWTGSKSDGYGKCRFQTKFQNTHRVSWKLANGEIPDGMCVLHKCDNPPCCNPDHLFLGTKLDNARDCIAKGRFPDVASHGAKTRLMPGDKHRLAKITMADARHIRELRAAGLKLSEIAAIHSISVPRISSICTGKSWLEEPAPNAAEPA